MEKKNKEFTLDLDTGSSTPPLNVTPSEDNFGETEFGFHRFELNWLTEWAGQCSVARLDEHFDGVDCVRQEPYQTEARLADGCFLRDSLANSFAFQ